MEEPPKWANWHFRTNPFFPTDLCGNVIGELLLNSFNPLDNVSVLDYYYLGHYFTVNIVNERLSTEEMAFDRGERLRFSQTLKSDKATIALLLGDGRRHGLRSVRNLLVYDSLPPPHDPQQVIIVEHEVTQASEARILEHLAETLLLECSVHLDVAVQNRLDAAFARIAQDNEIDQWKNFFTNLLSRSLKRGAQMRPVIIHITGTELQRAETWELIYESIHGLASLLTITTTDRREALACLNWMNRHGHNSLLLYAKPFKIAETCNFLGHRLSYHREGGIDSNVLPDIAPFSTESLKALFAPGENLRYQGVPIDHPIDWINTTLKYAFERHIEESDGDASLISAEKMHEYRQEINR